MTNADRSLDRYACYGDQQAFKEVVIHHQAMVERVCYRILGNTDDAQDAAQDVFWKLARYAPTIKRNLAGWLHRCATTTAIDRLQTRPRHVSIESIPALTSAFDDDHAVWADVKPVLDRCLSELPDRDRQIICRYYLQGENMVELAGEKGVSKVAIKKRLDKAVDRLRRRIRRYRTCALLLLTQGLESLRVEVKTAHETCDPRFFEPSLIGPAGLHSASGRWRWTTVSLVFLASSAAIALWIGRDALRSTGADGPSAPPPSSQVQTATRHQEPIFHEDFARPLWSLAGGLTWGPAATEPWQARRWRLRSDWRLQLIDGLNADVGRSGSSAPQDLRQRVFTRTLDSRSVLQIDPGEDTIILEPIPPQPLPTAMALRYELIVFDTGAGCFPAPPRGQMKSRPDLAPGRYDVRARLTTAESGISIRLLVDGREFPEYHGHGGTLLLGAFGGSCAIADLVVSAGCADH